MDIRILKEDSELLLLQDLGLHYWTHSYHHKCSPVIRDLTNGVAIAHRTGLTIFLGEGAEAELEPMYYLTMVIPTQDLGTLLLAALPDNPVPSYLTALGFELL